ncbi:Hypothetical protein D9617_20g028890 [Elsinoe fawcettii]|nr:Hypothetical protein D9617_20g028890 [Elsinoe fawcettii]
MAPAKRQKARSKRFTKPPAAPPQRIVKAKGGNPGPIGWTVEHDKANNHWGDGVRLRRAYLPKDDSGRTPAASLHIRPGDWITVKYEGNNQEFANVRAIRQCGTPGSRDVFTMLLVAWGYGLHQLKKEVQGKLPSIDNANPPFTLDLDDIVMSDHFDIIYLENVNDLVEVEEVLATPGQNGRGDHVIKTRDFNEYLTVFMHVEKGQKGLYWARAPFKIENNVGAGTGYINANSVQKQTKAQHAAEARPLKRQRTAWP